MNAIYCEFFILHSSDVLMVILLTEVQKIFHRINPNSNSNSYIGNRDLILNLDSFETHNILDVRDGFRNPYP